MKKVFTILHPNRRYKLGVVVEREPGEGTFEIIRDNTQRFNLKPEYRDDEGIAVSRKVFKEFTRLDEEFGVLVKYIECYCSDLKEKYIITVQKFLENNKVEDYSNNQK